MSKTVGISIGFSSECFFRQRGGVYTRTSFHPGYVSPVCNHECDSLGFVDETVILTIMQVHADDVPTETGTYWYSSTLN